MKRKTPTSEPEPSSPLIEAVEAMTLMKKQGGLTITVHPLTFGRGRVSIGPDEVTITEFW